MVDKIIRVGLFYHEPVANTTALPSGSSTTGASGTLSLERPEDQNGDPITDNCWGTLRDATIGPRHMVVMVVDDMPPLAPWQQSVIRYNPQNAATIPAATDPVITGRLLYPQTPTINAAVTGGIRFDGVTGASVCSPFRASLHTGVHPHRHGLGAVVRADRDGPDVREFADSSALPAAGWPAFNAYKVLARRLDELSAAGSTVRKAYVGKLHLSNSQLVDPTYSEWDILDTSSESGLGRLGDWDKRCTLINNHNAVPVPGPGGVGEGGANDGHLGSYYFYRYKEDALEANEGTINSQQDDNQAPDGQYSTEFWFDKAKAWLNQINNETEKAFCLLTFTCAHSPFDEPPAADVATEAYLGTQRVWHRQMAMMEAFDANLARFINGLDPAVRDATTFVILADNGYDDVSMRSMHQDAGVNGLGAEWELVVNPEFTDHLKSSVYEAGIRSQMVVWGAGVTNPGRVSRHIIDCADLYPTIVQYFGGTLGSDPAQPLIDGIPFNGILADTVGANMTDHARVSSFAVHYYPNGSLNVINQEAEQGLWLNSGSYSIGDIVRYNRRHYIAIANSTPFDNAEPPNNAFWDELRRRDISFTKWVTGEPTPNNNGLFKVVRQYQDEEDNASTNDHVRGTPLEGVGHNRDYMFQKLDASGAAVDWFELEPLPIYTDTQASRAAYTNAGADLQDLIQDPPNKQG